MTHPAPFTSDDVADVLTRRRLDAGLTERELALRAEMTVGTYFRRMRGEARPFTFDEIARLALALQCRPSDLMRDVETLAKERATTPAGAS